MKKQLALLLATLLAVSLAADVIVYGDQLENNWQDWSWSPGKNFATTAVVYSGTKSIGYKPTDAYDAIYLHSEISYSVARYPKIEFYIHGGSAGGQQLTLRINEQSTPKLEAPLPQFVEGGAIVANAWKKVTVTLSTLGFKNTDSFKDITIQSSVGTAQAQLNIDAITIKEDPNAPIPTNDVNLAVNITRDRRPINQEIYGVNHANSDHFKSVHYTVNRKGGNAESRYNWEYGISNKGADWFFFNIAEDVANVAALPDGTSANIFVDQSRSAGSEPMLTASMIGFTPVNQRVKKWGYSVAKYGAQTKNECVASNYASWCTADAGNGVSSATNKKIIADYRDTSQIIDQNYSKRWVAYLKSKGKNVKYFSLDNEIGLWHDTHHDVFPNPLTYDEYWNRTATYGTALKEADSNIKTFGPAAWGWCEYWFSPADDCKVGADRNAHGNVPLIEYYIKKNCEHQSRTGVRPVDFLDVHFYPQGAGISLSDNDDGNTQAARLRSTKALYDKNYVDESWIAQPIYLLPRMKELIQNYCPGMKLAVTEYNFGNDGLHSGALAQAEALAIFGREGVDLATRWVVPAVGSKAENAFKLYLNYDGKHSNITGSSVYTSTSDIDKVGFYAIHNSNFNVTYLLIFNKDVSSVNANINLPEALSNTATLYGFTATNDVSSMGTLAFAAGKAKLVMQARSAVLAVVPVSYNAPAPPPTPQQSTQPKPAPQQSAQPKPAPQQSVQPQPQKSTQPQPQPQQSTQPKPIQSTTNPENKQDQRSSASVLSVQVMHVALFLVSVAFAML